jgi:hypothetical protein
MAAPYNDLEDTACTARLTVAGQTLTQRARIAGDWEIYVLLVHAIIKISRSRRLL